MINQMIKSAASRFLVGMLIMLGVAANAAAATAAAGDVGKVTYYHFDHLGSTLATTNETVHKKVNVSTTGLEEEKVVLIHTGGVAIPIKVMVAPVLGDDLTTEQNRYTAFGMHRDGSATLSTSTVGYTGHGEGISPSLTYMGARWYHPKSGRFMSPDPVMFVETHELSLNRYAYVQNSPYSYTDPDGRWLDLAIEVVSIGAGVASAVKNFSDGNIKDGLTDLAFVGVDVALAVVPGVPGGTGLMRQAAKETAEAAMDAAAASRKAPDCPGGVCALGDCSFDESTLVATENGYQEIANLKIGDYVYSANEKTAEVSLQQVLAVHSKEYLDTVYIEVTGADGDVSEIVSNRIHPFFAQVPAGLDLLVATEGHVYQGDIPQGAWVDAEFLQVGFKLLQQDGEWATVSNVRVENQDLLAYNITVDQDETYFVTGDAAGDAVWVHNCRFKRWSAGDAIDKPMADGSAPTWDVVRSRYWKSRANSSPDGEFSKENLERMRRGSAPQDYNRRTGQWESRELHHVVPQRHGGSNSPENLREMTPDQHGAVDPFRHTVPTTGATL